MGGNRYHIQTLFPPDEFVEIIDYPVIPYYKCRSFLHQKYVVERLSTTEIAKQIFSSHLTVLKYLKAFKIPIRKGEKNKTQLGY